MSPRDGTEAHRERPRLDQHWHLQQPWASWAACMSVGVGERVCGGCPPRVRPSSPPRQRCSLLLSKRRRQKKRKMQMRYEQKEDKEYEAEPKTPPAPQPSANPPASPRPLSIVRSRRLAATHDPPAPNPPAPAPPSLLPPPSVTPWPRVGIAAEAKPKPKKAALGPRGRRRRGPGPKAKTKKLHSVVKAKHPRIAALGRSVWLGPMAVLGCRSDTRWTRPILLRKNTPLPCRSPPQPPELPTAKRSSSSLRQIAWTGGGGASCTGSTTQLHSEKKSKGALVLHRGHDGASRAQTGRLFAPGQRSPSGFSWPPSNCLLPRV